NGADAAVLIDPSAALVDAEIIDALIARAAERERVLLCVSQPPPALGGAVVRPQLLERIAAEPSVLRDACEGGEFDDGLPLPTTVAECATSFRFASQRHVTG